MAYRSSRSAVQFSFFANAAEVRTCRRWVQTKIPSTLLSLSLRDHLSRWVCHMLSLSRTHQRTAISVPSVHTASSFAWICIPLADVQWWGTTPSRTIWRDLPGWLLVLDWCTYMFRTTSKTSLPVSLVLREHQWLPEGYVPPFAIHVWLRVQGELMWSCKIKGTNIRGSKFPPRQSFFF